MSEMFVFVVVSLQELSEEEKQTIILSGEFQRFLDRAGRLMERAVCESVDRSEEHTSELQSR
jgi:dynein intermediate chain